MAGPVKFSGPHSAGIHHGPANVAEGLHLPQKFVPSPPRSIITAAVSAAPSVFAPMSSRFQELRRTLFFDRMNPSDAALYREQNGPDIFDMAMGMRKASCESAAVEKHDLLRAAERFGDRRSDIPEPWRFKVKEAHMERGEYLLHVGYDDVPNRTLARMWGAFGEFARQPGDIAELVAAFEEYLQSGRDDLAVLRAQRTILADAAWEACRRGFGGRLDNGPTDHATLLRLQKFVETWMIPRAWTALDAMRNPSPPESEWSRHIAAHLRPILAEYSPWLVKSWLRLPDEQLCEELSTAAQMHDPESVLVQSGAWYNPVCRSTQCVLERRWFDPILWHSQIPALREALQVKQQGRSADRSNFETVKATALRELFEGFQVAIDAELARYIYHIVSSVDAGLRPVKGVPYILWAMHSGVPLGFYRVLDLWHDPHFQLFAITNEGAQSVEGFIPAMIMEGDGGKSLVVLGVYPLADFLARVPVREWYRTTIAQLSEFAAEAVCSSLCIAAHKDFPKGPRAIENLIEEMEYPTRLIRWVSPFMPSEEPSLAPVRVVLGNPT